MAKKVFFWILLGLLIIYCIVISLFALSLNFHQKKLKADLQQTKTVKERVVEEMIDLQEERAAIQEESERMNAELVSHLAKQEEWKAKSKELQTALDAFKGKHEGSDGALKDFEKKIKWLETKNVKLQEELATEKIKQSSKGAEDPSTQIKLLEEKLMQERAVFYYNLGVAYDRGNMKEEALKAYKKSIEIDPAYADVYYNLGILYEEALYDGDRALEAYQKFVELSPQSVEAAKVKQWIAAIQAKNAASYN